MKIFNIDKNFKNVPKINEKFNLCLGFFDGIHLGHRKIIAAASKNGNKIGIITFVRKNNVEKYITPINERLDFFKKLNISFVFVLPFSKKIMNISHFFFKKNFLDVIKPTILFAGEDFKFGKNRLGNIEYLKKFFSVKVIKFKKKNNEKISSSKIKEMIRFYHYMDFIKFFLKKRAKKNFF